MHRLVAVAQDEEAERQRCRWPLGGALIGFLLCVAGWVVVDAVAAPFQNFSGFIFALLMTFEGGALYSGWLTLWYGIPLVVLSVPSAWRNVVQGAVLLLLWLGSLFYFIPASSGLMSIVERTSGWIVFAAAIVGLLGFMLGGANRWDVPTSRPSSTCRCGIRVRAVLYDQERNHARTNRRVRVRI